MYIFVWLESQFTTNTSTMSVEAKIPGVPVLSSNRVTLDELAACMRVPKTIQRNKRPNKEETGMARPQMEKSYAVALCIHHRTAV